MSAGREQCDCTVYCGDDSRIREGKADPCNLFREWERRKRMLDAAPHMLDAMKRAVAVSERNAPDVEYCDEWQAVMADLRAAIAFVEGTPT